MKKHPALQDQLELLIEFLNADAPNLVRIAFNRIEEYRNGVIEFISDEKLLDELDKEEASLRYMEKHPWQETGGSDDKVADRIEILRAEANERGLLP